MSEDQEREKLSKANPEDSASDDDVEAHKLDNRGAAEGADDEGGDDVEAHKLGNR